MLWPIKLDVCRCFQVANNIVMKLSDDTGEITDVYVNNITITGQCNAIIFGLYLKIFNAH